MSDIIETAPPVETPIIKTDGREQRSVNNRAVLVAAGMRLIERDNNWRATSTQIIEEAGISKRTFFNHFTNVEYFRQVLMNEHGDQLLALAGRITTLNDVVKALMR